MSLRDSLSAQWRAIQGELLPFLDDAIGPLTPLHRQLAAVLEMARVERAVVHLHGRPGRPLAERAALARAFVAKAVFNLPTTRTLIERLQGDGTLRRLCGWSRLGEVPSEATFSRAFAEFAASQMPSRLHEALIRQTQAERLIGHIARDSTAIVAREAPRRRATLPKSTPAPARRRRGRPRKGEASPPREPSRLERQRSMSLDAMLADLPRRCDTGIERDAKGFQTRWTGYKLHIDTADGDIPISCVLTSASVHDSQVAIPLATLTAGRVTSLYDLMDSAYDAAEIRDHSRSLGHVPIIATNPRARTGLKGDLAQQRRCLSVVGHRLAQDVRYNERTSAERVNANLKDNHGGETVRVRGNAKVMCHLMLGIVAIAAVQVLRLVT